MSAIDDLVTELARLPGIGRKTAQRLTFHLLKQPPEIVERLAEAIRRVRAQVEACGVCGNLSDEDPCAICSDPRRDATVLCVVEEAGDVGAIERAGGYRGRYHVLGGRLSPVTRIARGLPVGGDLEYADGVTIAQSLLARRDMAESE